jgi:hypothetical protein
MKSDPLLTSDPLVSHHTSPSFRGYSSVSLFTQTDSIPRNFVAGRLMFGYVFFGRQAKQSIRSEAVA